MYYRKVRKDLEELLFNLAKNTDGTDHLIQVRIVPSIDGTVSAKIGIGEDEEKGRVFHKDNIAIVFINIDKDGALACEKAEELCVDKSNGNIILCAEDTIEHGLEDLFRHISYHDSLIVGSIYDLVAGDDVEKLAEEIEYLTDLEVTIFSKKEGTHPAEYFFEMITLAKKMLPEKEEDQEE